MEEMPAAETVKAEQEARARTAEDALQFWLRIWLEEEAKDQEQLGLEEASKQPEFELQDRNTQ